MQTVMLLAILLATLFAQGLCYPPVDATVLVFYVKPTVPTTECPSGKSLCHSLQYYANHSSFTSNSMFLFLGGEHHLDSVVNITNVVNLSLVGNSPGVKILCKTSLPAGFRFVEFIGLSIENITFSNCGGSETALLLYNGSEASLDYVTISGYSSMGLAAENVVGSFSVSNSVFSALHGENIEMQYSLCNASSLFDFSNNTLRGHYYSEAGDFGYKLKILIGNCSGVRITITDSIFEFGNDLVRALFIYYSDFPNNSILVSNSMFRDEIKIHADFFCNDTDLNCGHNFINFINVTISARVQWFSFGIPTYAALIENSLISTSFGVWLNTSHISLHNVTLNNTLLSITGGATISLISCTLENNEGPGIYTHGSQLIFEGNNTIRNSLAMIGAGILLTSFSHMHLRPHTYILLENNHAEYVGGAIATDSNEQDSCFFLVDSPNLSKTIRIDFVNNTAKYAGSSLYGGIYPSQCCSDASCKDFFEIFHTSNTENEPSAIATDISPYKICFCEDGRNQPDCSLGNNISVEVFPGQEFPIRVAVIDSTFGAVVTEAVRALFLHDIFSLDSTQISQVSNKPSCNNFNYSVSFINTSRKNVEFILTPEQNLFNKMVKQFSYVRARSENYNYTLTVSVYLKDCPIGFSLSSDTGKCVCNPVIYGRIKCNINDQGFLRPTNTWLGFINESGVVFHPNCPIEYCSPDDVNITINTSNSQCEPHRTGLLCGKCEDGYSLTLGIGECEKCSNIHLLIILPLAVAGLFLVAVLFALNLTVTEGSVNGLIFYANIIGMNYTIFQSRETSYLYTILAWLNLDLGITTCLFDGLDGYAETWLQFIFPVYLWFIILVIIQFYRKFPTLANRLGGENAVKVLATLLLLSYTKLQRTVVTIMSFTRLEYPNGDVHYVWLYDANVEFFKGKHLYLGVAGILVLVFLIAPYTLCLAFFQQLQSCSGHRLFKWVNKLKPLFDSYAGPYKDKYRFWTGMLLVVRTLLIILFTINAAGSVDFNLLIISVVSCALLMAHSNGVYKKWPYNYLESFSYLQLAVFAAGVNYAGHVHRNIAAVADTSFGLTLLMLLVIMGYQVLCHTTTFKGYYYRLRGYADIADQRELSYTHERLN